MKKPDLNKIGRPRIKDYTRTEILIGVKKKSESKIQGERRKLITKIITLEKKAVELHLLSAKLYTLDSPDNTKWGVILDGLRNLVFENERLHKKNLPENTGAITNRHNAYLIK